jgi:glyoxylase-like metal-dependent hydrolase (beta-lactamase superfamily II)
MNGWFGLIGTVPGLTHGMGTVPGLQAVVDIPTAWRPFGKTPVCPLLPREERLLSEMSVPGITFGWANAGAARTKRTVGTRFIFFTGVPVPYHPLARTTMEPLALLLAVPLLHHGGVPHHPQRDFADVQIKATPVAGTVHMLEGAGGNIGVSVGEDGILIVDDQFAPLADRIRAALRSLGEGKLRFVLNTHWHGDHTGGNAAFGGEASILAHANVRRRLENPPRGEPSPKEALPIVTFDESLSVHFNGEEIRMVHLPGGHTDGDAVIRFTRSNVVHMGDLFFAGRFPFIDLSSGGSVDGYLRNVEKALAEIPPDAKIIPGHGPLSTVEDLRTFHRMLRETVAFVRERQAAGKSLADVQKEGLPAPWASWGWEFIPAERWIEIVWGGAR